MSLTLSLPGSFDLAPDEVHSWCASLDVPPETSARLYATLTPGERNRSARFYFERDRERFIVAHGVLRHLLARYLQTEPGRIVVLLTSREISGSWLQAFGFIPTAVACDRSGASGL
jgi:hypothetical protein